MIARNITVGFAIVLIAILGMPVAAMVVPGSMSGKYPVQSGDAAPPPPASPVKLIFIHHSTGENWLADDNGGLGIALRDNNYFISDTNYGWGPDGIGSNTDIGNWYDWFRGPDSPTYLADLYNESGQWSSYSRLSTDPGGRNRIVMFKSCFPNSALQGDPDDPVPSIVDNPLKGQGSGSGYHTVANAKGIYIDLLEYFTTKQDTLFIVVAAPPLSDPAYAGNARAFNQWLVNDWLKDYPHKNVYVFDFYNVLTTNGGSASVNDLDAATGNHHRWWDGAVQHQVDMAYNTSAYPSGDDHPSQAGNLKATAEYLPLLNYAYNQWTASITPPPEADFTANRTYGFTPLVVAFSDTSAGMPTQWNWSFGDGTWFNTTSVESRNPVHTYGVKGLYNVTLKVANGNGSSTSQPTTITASPQSSLTGIQVFPSDHIWNTPVDTLPVSAHSADYINSIGPAVNLHPDFGADWEGEQIGIPFIVVNGTQPKVPVTFEYADESDPGPYPIPPYAPVEGGPDSDGDRHILIIENDSHTLYELFAASRQADGSWAAGSGAVFNLSNYTLRPSGWTSADAAGLAILPGLVTYDEVQAGEITHAIRFTARNLQRAYVWPARHYASSLTGTQYPPYGQRFRLKASYDISGFPPREQVILTALKKYGMILADGGSNWFISGTSDNRWDNEELAQLKQLTGSDFEAVDATALMINPDSGQARPSTVAPVAGFTATPTYGTAPLIVRFTDISTGSPTSWNWTFGDGSRVNATKQNPVHTYTRAGTYTVSLNATNAGGSDVFTRTDYITVTARPVVSGISPAKGPTAGNTLVTITGTGFTGTTAVRFGTSKNTTPLRWVSAKKITVRSPAHAAGTVDVKVTTPGGTSAAVPKDRFTYVARPTVSSIYPTKGPTSGSTLVTINGTGFTGATAVRFGMSKNTTPLTWVSARKITVRSPAHAAGTVDVKVTTPGGISAAVPKDRFTYVVRPAVTSISPTSGTRLGGTRVTILGSQFKGATAVWFGTSRGKNVTVNTLGTKITVRSPAHTAGTVNVKVTTAGGTSAAVPGDRFRYI